MEVFDTLYVFLCTSYLVTPLDLVTVFWETKCVTKSGLHCMSVLAMAQEQAYKQYVFKNAGTDRVYVLFSAARFFMLK